MIGWTDTMYEQFIYLELELVCRWKGIEIIHRVKVCY